MASRRFTFRLQKVLDYRETVEQRIQGELAALGSDKLRATKEREHLQDRRDVTLNRLVELQRGELDLFEDTLQRNFARDLEAQIVRKVIQIREIDKRIVAKREELVQAAKECKVMERLRENAWQEHVTEQLRAEQNTLDEIGGQGFIRRRAEREAHVEGRQP